jgi:hypothetical protein
LTSIAIGGSVNRRYQRSPLRLVELIHAGKDAQLQRYVAFALFAVVETGVNTRSESRYLVKSEPGGIEVTKFFLGFLKHAKVNIAFDGPQTSHGLHVLRANRFDNNPAHKPSKAFDELGVPAVQRQEGRVAVPLSGAMTESAADTAASTVSWFPDSIRSEKRKCRSPRGRPAFGR